jgi:RNA polymerase sigma-70 factor (ECF subfamily)
MHLKLLDDKELVELYINGQEVCFEILLERHKRKVFTKILLMVKDRATSEDIFQDVFIKVVNTLKSGKYNEEGKFLPWVMRIAHNMVIDHFRRVKKIPAFRSTDEDFDIFNIIKCNNQSAEENLIKTQTDLDIQNLINRLPKEQKEVLFMRHYADLSFNEIAEQTGVSINTALGRMRYALLHLRKLMEKHKIVTMQ